MSISYSVGLPATDCPRAVSAFSPDQFWQLRKLNPDQKTYLLNYINMSSIF